MDVGASGTSFCDEMDLTGYFCQGQRSPKRRERGNPQRETDESLVATLEKATRTIGRYTYWVLFAPRHVSQPHCASESDKLDDEAAKDRNQKVEESKLPPML